MLAEGTGTGLGHGRHPGTGPIVAGAVGLLVGSATAGLDLLHGPLSSVGYVRGLAMLVLAAGGGMIIYGISIQHGYLRDLLMRDRELAERVFTTFDLGTASRRAWDLLAAHADRPGVDRAVLLEVVARSRGDIGELRQLLDVATRAGGARA